VAPESRAASGESRREASGALNAPQVAPAAPPAPSPPALARSARAPAAQPSLGVAADAPMEEQALKGDPAARGDRASASAPRPPARIEAARDFERSAAQWIEHIVRLRGEGRQAEADAELKRFRERYPEATVPGAALPPNAGAGTR
jgi:hypothetical protein